VLFKSNIDTRVRPLHTHNNLLISCYTANQDPIATIMGPAYASLNSSTGGGKNVLIEAHENLERERARGNTGPHVDELDSSFKLLLLLNTLDTKLLHLSVQKIGK